MTNLLSALSGQFGKSLLLSTLLPVVAERHRDYEKAVEYWNELARDLNEPLLPGAEIRVLRRLP